MLLKKCIYFIIIVMSLLSIPILIYSMKSKNKRNDRSIKIISTFYIVYLILNLIVIPFVFNIYIGFEFVFFEFVTPVAIINYIISIVVCSKKIKKIKERIPFSKIAIVSISLWIILPVSLLSYSLLKEYYFILHSDLILVYKSSGNGGIGDSNIFAYAISEDYIQEISLGLSIGDSSLAEYLPKKVTKIDNVENLNHYKILLDDYERTISVYKNNNLIHEKAINPSYYNISFDGGFYINNY